VAPGDLVPRAAEHDIGLALEQPVNRNRDLCATNKIFTYLLAGLAVAATDTTGQRWVMNAAPGAGFVYRPGDAAGLAAGLRQLLETPGALTAARAAAREAADRRFHFEAEAPGLVAYLEGAVR
jgi:glycosyltransferase involved in cell wall biosynthesis